MQRSLTLALALLTGASAQTVMAQDVPPPGEPQLEEVLVQGVRERLHQAGTLKDAIQKTEVVDSSLIESMRAVNLSQAIQQAPGVRVSNECSMCGVKRIMLNGLRGEHTTILTDGIPLHTMLAGFYAVDALATTGVERIEIARGAGASLISPEAVGGTINVISKTADQTGLELDMWAGDDDGYQVGAIGNLVSQDGRTRLSLVTQFDRLGQIDDDDNKVSEAPEQENENYIARLSHDFSDSDNITARIAYTDSEIFGGPTTVSSINGALNSFDGVESEQLFVDDDVRERFIGKPWETTEWIDTERTEVSTSWLHEFNERYNTTLSAAYSKHEQDSFYEGFDYEAEDELVYLDFRNNYVLTDNHLLTFGIDMRSEEMRSDSVAGEASDRYIEDSFDYDVVGVYLQDTWSVNDSLEIALAVRVDQVEADFIADEKPGTEIDETVIAPRIDLRYLHSDAWTSRVSVGLGYRAPLSFFETDHGILDAGDGYAIDVDDLEESLSTTYALSFAGERLTSTLSLAYTEVDDLAALDETEDGIPLLTQLDDTASVFAGDIALGYRVNDWLTLDASFEHYNYDSNFEESFAVAPVEERVILAADVEYGGWDIYTSAIWVGSRDLSNYGYEGFNVRFSDQLKSTDADSYWTMDMRISRDIGNSISFYVGATNLFDYTQVDDEDTPLFWDADGAYDVAYIYGPLRGRELYAGFTYRL